MTCSSSPAAAVVCGGGTTATPSASLPPADPSLLGDLVISSAAALIGMVDDPDALGAATDAHAAEDDAAAPLTRSAWLALKATDGRAIGLAIPGGAATIAWEGAGRAAIAAIAASNAEAHMASEAFVSNTSGSGRGSAA